MLAVNNRFMLIANQPIYADRKSADYFCKGGHVASIDLHPVPYPRLSWRPLQRRRGVVHAGGYLGLVAAALAAYPSCAKVCEATYKRSVLPVFPLAQH